MTARRMESRQPHHLDRNQAVFSERRPVRMEDSETDVARIVNFDSFHAYRWLVSIAERNPKLNRFLRGNGVDLNHVFNLLGGAIALCRHSFSGPNGPKEDCIFLPVMDEDGVTPLDVAMFSMANPARFETMLKLGVVLGLDQVFNPATYWGGEPCCLLPTPLEWLAAGIESCAVVLDPSGAKPILDWAPGNVAAVDNHHADELVEMGAVDPARLVVPLRRAA
jgi:hypothetical protein